MAGYRSGIGTAIIGVACIAAAVATGIAHETHAAGVYRLTIGWGDEPAFTHIRNSVSVEITEAGKGPIAELGGGALLAEISFGDERVTLPLHASPARRNLFQAFIVPTRAGTYTFRITGAIKTQAVDVSVTCSDRTFDCVADASQLHFPAKDPSAGQVAERLDRSLPRAEQALEAARGARMVSISALALAGAALVCALAFGLRKPKSVH
jgi:hypothetical protein